VLRSENVEFDAVHLMERYRLFLIIAPGEAVLTTATPTSAADGFHSAMQRNNHAPAPGDTP
jgi:low temperature requirement protein LtrA